MINKETINLKMKQKLEETASFHPEILNEICEHYNIEHIWQLPIVEFYAALGYTEWRLSLIPKNKTHWGKQNV